MNNPATNDNQSASNVSIILPAKNESASLQTLLPLLRQQQPEAQIIVVNDGSNDNTDEICREIGVEIIKHPYSMGNGAAIKSGARAAKNDILVFMDADGQHAPEDIVRLLAKLVEGYDMVIGARHFKTQASLSRGWANAAFNWIASIMTGYRILDLTSGFRAVRTSYFRKFIYLLPNGFSYPTTITMAFLRSGLAVTYVPIEARQREGKSHISMLKDGIRFFIIILKVGTLFSPMRLFFPVSAAFFVLGIGYYAYTYATVGRFTNMSALLFIYSVLTFLIGIVSEQISALHYKGTEMEHQHENRNK